MSGSESDYTVARVSFEAPVFIIAAPRSGSTLLYAMLARSPDVWTVGGESHRVFESIPQFVPANRPDFSNRLLAEDAEPEVIATLADGLASRLRNHEDQPPIGDIRVRMLEKTPKNALRVGFLARAFPDAQFIFLTRDARENTSRILDAWRSQKFVTYSDLPGWERAEKWSLALVPGWAELHDLPLAEIAARQLQIINELALDELSRIPRHRWTHVSYEELVANPHGTARRLCEFTGLRWMESAWDSSAPSQSPDGSGADTWRRNEAALSPFLSIAESAAARIAAVVAAPVAPLGFSGSPAATGEAPRALPPPVSSQVAGSSPDFTSEHTDTFAQVLAGMGISLAVTTGSAGRLILLREADGLVNTHFEELPFPMGLAFRDGRLAIGCRGEVWTFRGFSGQGLGEAAVNDCVFLPGNRRITGITGMQDLAWCGPELWAVNTRFSCLCTFDGLHSFVPRWVPPFISRLAPEERCHLSGLAVAADGAGVARPVYATAYSHADTAGGWREGEKEDGLLIHCESGEVLARGLAMPHSPRVYDGKLWVLEGLAGCLSVVNPATGAVERVATFPGFARGLDFAGTFAFVGTSKTGESSPADHPAGPETQCGVWVVDLRTMQTVAFLRFSGTVREIIAVSVLPMRFPDLRLDDPELMGTAFVLPK